MMRLTHLRITGLTCYLLQPTTPLSVSPATVHQLNLMHIHGRPPEEGEKIYWPADTFQSANNRFVISIGLWMKIRRKLFLLLVQHLLEHGRQSESLYGIKVRYTCRPILHVALLWCDITIYLLHYVGTPAVVHSSLSPVEKTRINAWPVQPPQLYSTTLSTITHPLIDMET